MRKLFAIAIAVFFASSVPARAEAWRNINMQGESAVGTLKTRPAQANPADQNPPQAVPGNPAPPACSDAIIVDRVTKKVHSGLSDFFTGRTYVVVRMTNPYDVAVDVDDFFGTIVKSLCQKGSATALYQWTPNGRKNPSTVILRAWTADRKQYFDSPMIPLYLPRTNAFFWTIGEEDTRPSLKGFQDLEENLSGYPYGAAGYPYGQYGQPYPYGGYGPPCAYGGFCEIGRAHV
jgi:hypothetical protein